MTANAHRMLSCFGLFLALSVTLGLTPQTRQTQDASRHVVLISLDGFPSWALDDPYLPIPALRRLAARGAVARGMRPVNPTVTWPDHTSLITAVNPSTDPDLSALFVASGAGIDAGVKLDVINNVDVAPTMADLLGVALENTDGRVLKEILTSRR